MKRYLELNVDSDWLERIASDAALDAEIRRVAIRVKSSHLSRTSTSADDLAQIGRFFVAIKADLQEAASDLADGKFTFRLRRDLEQWADLKENSLWRDATDVLSAYENEQTGEVTLPSRSRSVGHLSAPETYSGQAMENLMRIWVAGEADDEVAATPYLIDIASAWAQAPLTATQRTYALLRAAGHPMQEIAASVGVTHEGARQGTIKAHERMAAWLNSGSSEKCSAA